MKYELEAAILSIIISCAGEERIPTRPDRQPFRMCLAVLEIDPIKAVCVGDDYRIDIRGAEKAGLQAIWIKHHLVKRNWPEGKTFVPVTASLDELFKLEKLFPYLIL